MARRGKQDAAVGFLLLIGIVVGLPVWLFSRASDAIGPVGVVILLISLIVVVVFVRGRVRAGRRANLLTKYGDPHVVDLIMRRNYWEGQTSQQLLDSIGSPVAIDDHFLKTKKKQVWKYHRSGRNRYKLRLTLENDVVVGWDSRV